MLIKQAMKMMFRKTSKDYFLPIKQVQIYYEVEGPDGPRIETKKGETNGLSYFLNFFVIYQVLKKNRKEYGYTKRFS